MTDSIGDGAFRLPSWYGSSQTPYDYQPPSRLAQSGEDGRLRVLLDAGTSLSLSLQINNHLISTRRKFKLLGRRVRQEEQHLLGARQYCTIPLSTLYANLVDLPPRSDLLPYVLSLLHTLRISDQVDIYQPVPYPSPSQIPPSGGDADPNTARQEAEAIKEAERLEDERWAEQCRRYDLVWRIEQSPRGSSGTFEGDRERRKRRGCGDVPVLRYVNDRL